MSLYAWQKIDRVLTGSSFGDGASGSATISSDPNTRATATGTASSASVTAGSTSFANGDLVLLHQTQGTGAGQWEINRVSSGGGTTSLTMQIALQYTYGTGAQIIKVPRYTTATVSAHSVTAWNGTTGGIEVLAANTSVTISGALNAASVGFRGEKTEINENQNGIQGESQSGTGTRSRSANGTGGGGGTYVSADRKGGGAGGGNATAGENGQTKDLSLGGLSGTTTNNDDLSSMTFGGAGGQGAYYGQSAAISQAGNSGGIVVIFAKSFTNSSSVSVNGETGTNAAAATGGGGSGAGGNILIVCETASLGTNTLTAAGGSRTVEDSNNGYGGAGGNGRIAIHHSGTVTGSTNPTFYDIAYSSQPDYQKITRVLPGNSFGDGVDGTATISSDPNTRATITGTSGSTSATAGSTSFADGDLVMLHQTRGTGAGQWEINQVSSGGGTTSLTMSVSLQYTYGTGAQIIKIPRYNILTVNATALTAWNESTGGVMVLCGKTSVTVSGAITANGKGHIGRSGAHGSGVTASQGEGYPGAGTTSTSANGSSGGGSYGDIGGGSGASHATSGTAGTYNSGSVGSTVGTTDLTTIYLGGAGGSCKTNLGTKTGDSVGGYGGGIVIIFSKSITLSAGVNLNGAQATGIQGESSTVRKTTSGGGAGGSCLLVCETASLGTNQMTATGASALAAGGTEPFNGGAGGNGRISIRHSGTITGTTSPTFVDVADIGLVSSMGGSFIFNLL